VYGPWGRPDMALFLFTRAILAGEPIQVFNHGKMQRDFTYIDDIAEGVVRIAGQPAQASPAFDAALPDPATSWAPYRLYNIGNHHPVSLMDYIEAIEACLGKKAEKKFLPMQAGDVPRPTPTPASCSRPSALRLARRWPRACGASSSGTGAITTYRCRPLDVILSAGSTMPS